MPLIADKRDYRKGYNRHRTAANMLGNENKYSRRLLLFYSVECGLKYLLMNKWGIMSVSEIEADQEKNALMHTHNIEKILKELGQQGMFRFPGIKTCHNQVAHIESYHQACRYGIEIDNRDFHKEQEIENKLCDLVDWIKEEI